MPSYNSVTLIGHLTRDPELKYLQSGTAVCRFGLAVNRKWSDKSGQQKEEVVFIDVDCMGRTAENVSKYMKKGSALLVAGRIKQDTWDDKATGQKRSKLGVFAETVQFMGGRSESAGSASDVPTVDNGRAADTKEDDVPF